MTLKHFAVGLLAKENAFVTPHNIPPTPDLGPAHRQQSPPMKRPATDPPEIEPFRARRRFASPQPAAILNLRDQPHPGRVSDDEQAQSSTQVLPKFDTSICQQSLSQSMDDATNVSDVTIKHNLKPQNGTIIGIGPKDNSTLDRSTRRPLRRIKLILPREPSPSDLAAETDSNLNTPIMTPTGLRAPPSSPSHDYESDGGRHSRPKNHSEIPREGEEVGIALEVVKRSISPIAVSELFEPDHRAPTPPYYVQHFDEPGFNGYEGDSKSLTTAGRNANTYVRKATFPRPSKRQKSKGVWSFKNCEEYPRGETPTLEMILGKEEDDPDTQAVTKKEETETESEEDEEVSRDPGIPVTLTVGIDGGGRFLCKWGACDKSFARNDHLGRHVRVSHLRVRKHRCEPCGMAFIGVKGLRNHERTHNLHTNTSETAVSGDEDPEQDADGEMDFIFTKKSPPMSYSLPTAYMFEPDGEEET